MSRWDNSSEPVVRRRPLLAAEVEPVKEPKSTFDENVRSVRRGPRLMRKYASAVGKVGPPKCHIPSHLRAELSKEACKELEILCKKCEITVEEAAHICKVGGINDNARTQQCIASCLLTKDDTTLNTQEVINWIAKAKSDGGHFFIKKEPTKLPLPPCCNNPACRVCLRRSCARGSTFTPCQRELYTVYCGWMRLTGKIALKDIFSILHTYDISADRDAVTRAFIVVDAGAKGMLTFEEFFAIMEDLNAADFIARKRSDAYRLDANCCVFDSKDDATHATGTTVTTVSTSSPLMFTEDETTQLKHHFGAFDVSGDGLLDMQELRQALHEMGHRVSDRWLAKAMDAAIEGGQGSLQNNTRHKSRRKSREIILQQAYKRSLNFSQFLTVMSRLKSIETDAKNIKSASSSRRLVGTQALLAEAYDLTSIEAELPRGVAEIRFSGADSTTIQASYMGSALKGTPYAQHILRLSIRASASYPLRAPLAHFTGQFVHLNFEIFPNGTTHLTQLMKCWDPATWNLSKFLTRVYDLLVQPDPSLLPSNLNRGTRHDPRLADTDGILRLPLGFDLRSRPVSYTVLAELAFCYQNRKQDYLALAAASAKEHLEPYEESDE